jgi:hypothetical protein
MSKFRDVNDTLPNAGGKLRPFRRAMRQNRRPLERRVPRGESADSFTASLSGATNGRHRRREDSQLNPEDRPSGRTESVGVRRH